MANPPRPKCPKLVRIVVITIVALIILMGLSVLITWLVIKPKKLAYTIEEGSIRNFNLTHDHLTANFDFVFKAHNPNHKISVYYDPVEVHVSYDDQTVAFYNAESFFQPHKNVTKLEVKPVAKNVPLLRSVARDLRLEKSAGVVKLKVFLKAKIRFKVGAWKSRRQTLKIMCDPVFVHLSSESKRFEKVYCDIDL